jgi:hypothetical protein
MVELLLIESNIDAVQTVERSALQSLTSLTAEMDFQVEIEGNLTVQNVTANGLQLLKESGLFTLSDFLVVQRDEQVLDEFNSAASVSILQAVNGFHTQVPLPDGRIVHVISTQPRSPFEVLQVPGSALPRLPLSDLEIVDETSRERICTIQPYLGDTISQVLSADTSSAPVRAIVAALSSFLLCVSKPDPNICHASSRARHGSLASGLPSLQILSFSSFAEILRNPALRMIYVGAGCARPHSLALGTSAHTTAQDALAELDSMSRCLSSCQEYISGASLKENREQEKLRWKPGWCSKVCPSAVGLYDSLACSERLPQRLARALGEQQILTGLSHGVSFADGFIPYCALSQDTVNERSAELRKVLSAHLVSLLRQAAARHWEVLQHVNVLADATTTATMHQNKQKKLSFMTDAKMLHWAQADVNSTQRAAHVLEASGLINIARDVLHIRSAANLFTGDELAQLFANLNLRVSVRYPSALSSDAQQAIREAFGDPAEAGLKRRKKAKKRRRQKEPSQ